MKIRIYEKNKLFSDMLKMLLENDKHYVSVFNDSDSFIKKLHYELYDVVILDLDFINKKTLELIKILLKEQRNTYIIGLTVNLHPNNEIYKLYGVHYIIKKPFKYKELKEKLREVEINNKILKYFTKTRDKNILFIINKNIAFDDNYTLIDISQMKNNYKIKKNNEIFLINNVEYMNPENFKKFVLINMEKLNNKNNKFIFVFNDKKEIFDNFFKNIESIREYFIKKSYIMMF